MSSEFVIRPMRRDDEPFVYRAWLEGYWPHSGAPLIMSKSEWLPRWHRVIEHLLDTPEGGALVAHIEGKPEQLLGFASSGHGCLHWCYVKQAFRGLGIARELLKNFTCECDYHSSHWHPSLFRAGWRYDPMALQENQR